MGGPGWTILVRVVCQKNLIKSIAGPGGPGGPGYFNLSRVRAHAYARVRTDNYAL